MGAHLKHCHRLLTVANKFCTINNCPYHLGRHSIQKNTGTTAKTKYSVYKLILWKIRWNQFEIEKLHCHIETPPIDLFKNLRVLQLAHARNDGNCFRAKHRLNCIERTKKPFILATNALLFQCCCCCCHRFRFASHRLNQIIFCRYMNVY